MQKASRLLAIDLLRFLCAAAVLNHHYVGGWSLRSEATGRPGGWAAVGWIGVELFFVLSGYAIALSAEGSGAAAFLRRRALRLLPGAWIAASFTALVLVATDQAPIGDILLRWCGSVAFWPIAPQIDGSYWTLGLETVFYLLVAAALARGRLSLEPMAAILTVLSLTYWLAAGGWHSTTNPPFLLSLTLIPHGAFFATGIVLLMVARSGWTWGRALVMMLASLGAACEIMAHARLMNAAIGRDAGPWLPLALYIAGLAVVAGSGRVQPWLARSRWIAPILFLGAISYPLYLVHQAAGSALILTLMRFGLPATGATIVVAASMLAIAVGIARYGEPRLRAWLADRLDALMRSHAPRRDSRPIASPPIG